MKDDGNYQPYSYFQLMEVSLRELLVEKGIVTEVEVEAAVEDMRQRTPERGARVVARAWCDPAFRQRLLADGTRACEELGLDVPALKLVVVERHRADVCKVELGDPDVLLDLNRPEDYERAMG